MKLEEFNAGRWENGFKYRYFVPELINHSFSWNNEEINILLEKASLKLGELNSFSRFVLDTDMFIRMHVFKEAVVSSQIEGTKTNIEEALSDRNSVNPEHRDDWLEVNNYVDAMGTSLTALESLPLSCRLLKETHKILLSNGRGERKTPGEFRTSQNWIGGISITDAAFVPPAADKLPELLSDFEKFLNNKELPVPDLIRIAIAHYQFETIHPFLEGNGRIGRLLITLFLVSSGILEKPLLYLSAFFEKHRTLYYDNLTAVREKNDMLRWVRFFLAGVTEVAEEGILTLKKILDLKADIEQNCLLNMGRRIKTAQTLLHELFKNPIVSIKNVQKMTGLTAKTAGDLVKIFTEKRILAEITEQQRDRVFVFFEYIQLFGQNGEGEKK